MTAVGRAPRPLLLRLAGLRGWRRGLLGFALGTVATLALPPVHAVPLLWLAFSGLALLLADATSLRRVFWDGWWFGFGFFTTSLYWMSEAMLVDPSFAWMIPFSLFGFPVFLGLFTGSATALAAALPAGRTALGRPLALALTWTAAEWLRGHLLTGFPWNLIGYAWTASELTMQPAALIGTYGISLITVWLAALPATLIGPRRPALAALGCGALVLLGLGLWSAARLPAAPAAVLPGIRLRLVQAAIVQQLKWRPEQRESIFDRHLQLSAMAGAAGITHFIWPEAAVPFYLADDGPRRELAGRIAPPDGLVITGTIRRESDPARPFRVWNSLIAIDHGGDIVAAYDKHHLVPFGEYIPFRSLVERLDLQMMAGTVDFSAGPGPQLLSLPMLPPVVPLICYEVIFADRLLPAGPRPGWLLTITNDAWFGLSSGPYQHFAMARMRSVEQGLALVRSANSGISAIVDPYGRIVARLGLGQSGVIDGPLPAPLEATVYARFGDLPALILWVAGLILSLLRSSVRLMPSS